MTEEKGKLTGRHVLLMLIAFFGVMFIANFIFIRAAVDTFPGLDEDKSYFQGLHYNDTLATRAEQAALGWAAEITEVVRKGDGGKVVIRVTKGETPLSALDVAGVIKRPASDREDQALAFKSLGEGLYEAEIAAFTPGAWDLAVRATSAEGEAFDIEARILAP